MKTAVQWYAAEAMKLELERAKGNISVSYMLRELINILKKAKQMEKEQIKDSYKQGFKYRDTWNWELEVDWEIDSNEGNEEEFEQYYNETFKQEKK